MSQFDYLEKFVHQEKISKQFDHDLRFELRKGIDSTTLESLLQSSTISYPNDLVKFYAVSYGADFGEYQLLTIEEIEDLRQELHTTYGSLWIDSIIPFIYVKGVGDVIAFDCSKYDNDRKYLVVDGFHEIPPQFWRGICYGFENWLRQMVNSQFRPFWFSHPPPAN